MNTWGFIGVVLVAASMVAAGAAIFGAGEPEAPATSNSTVAGSGAPVAPDASGRIPAKLSEAGFLAGRWQGVMGENKDSFVEEIWSEPNGRNAIGMFRWNKPDGTSSVQELLTITEEDGTLLLRLRHQSAAGVAWEEKDKPLVFALAEKSPTVLRFDALRDSGTVSRCRYALKNGSLFIDVEFAPPGADALAAGKKQRAPLNFVLTRTPL